MSPTIQWAIGLGVAWLCGFGILLYRIGKFEARVSGKLENLEESRKENKDAIREMRAETQRRFDDLMRNK